MYRRLRNLNQKDKEESHSNTRVLAEILKEDYEATKEELVDLPIEKVEYLRGRCDVLRQLIKLLP